MIYFLCLICWRRASDGSHIFTYTLDISTAVKAIVYIKKLNRVACALSNSRLFLINSKATPICRTSAEGSFVMTELGSDRTTSCLCPVIDNESGAAELWCGQSEGRMSIYMLHGNKGVMGHESIAHEQVTSGDVVNMVADGTYVWIYVSPGCVIYQWDRRGRSVINKLDCSKMVPCSESLKSIAIEEHLSPSNCQVSGICHAKNKCQ